ncbi:MAG: ankyrin repeat domain-containing protein [Gammaproteobacteria bacterium]|nr:ankyrin repeat domain-containing protein [Gammaproteobacteria bacterium]
MKPAQLGRLVWAHHFFMKSIAVKVVLAHLIVVGLAIFSPSALGSEQQLQTPNEKWISAIANDRVDTLVQMLDQHNGNKSEVVKLLRKVASNGKSALMVASKQGELALVKRMVESGANVNELTQTGGTPLMFAVLGNHITLARWLHQAGADINAKGSNGWSAATIAGAKGQAEMLRWLIEAGADMDSPDVYRFTPLMRAVDNQHVESVQILLTQGKASANFKDESGNTALHFAVANQQSEVIQLLLSHGANPSDANRDGITPIDLAKQHPALSRIFAQ